MELTLDFIEKKHLPAVLGLLTGYRESDIVGLVFDTEKRVVGKVALIDGEIVAVVIYQMLDDRIKLITLVVKEAWRRRRIGTAIVNSIKERLHHDRLLLRAVVNEMNDEAISFLSFNLFRARKVLRSHYRSRDGIVFEFHGEVSD